MNNPLPHYMQFPFPPFEGSRFSWPESPRWPYPYPCVPPWQTPPIFDPRPVPLGSTRLSPADFSENPSVSAQPAPRPSLEGVRRIIELLAEQERIAASADNEEAVKTARTRVAVLGAFVLGWLEGAGYAPAGTFEARLTAGTSAEISMADTLRAMIDDPTRVKWDRIVSGCIKIADGVMDIYAGIKG